MAVPGQAWHVRAMVLMDPCWTTVLQHFLPSSCPLMVNPSADQLAPLAGFIDLCLSDEPWSPALRTVISALRIPSVILPRAPRRTPAPFRVVSLMLPHQDVGGVTTTAVRVVLLSSRPLSPFTLPDVRRRSLGAILEETPSGHPRPRPAPLDSLASVLLRATPPLYHGHGWLPPNPSFATRILAPCLWHPPATWVHRSLTWHELALAYGCASLSSCVPLGCRRAILSQLRPIECLGAALRWFHGVLVEVRGGGVSSSSHPADASISRPDSISRPEPCSTSHPEEATTVQAIASTDKAGVTKAEETDRTGLTQATGAGNDILRRIASRQRAQKATKADSAPVPVELWDYMLYKYFPRELSIDEQETIFDLAAKLRVLGLRVWRRKLWKEWQSLMPLPPAPTSIASPLRWREEYQRWWYGWMQALGDHASFGQELVRRVGRATWWEWAGGSSLWYWRWPEEYRDRAQFGLRIHQEGKAPRNRRGQQTIKDPDLLDKIKRKVLKVVDRDYIGPGSVVSLMDYFDVPKGEDDVRIVYNGSSSGLNDILWVI